MEEKVFEREEEEARVGVGKSGSLDEEKRDSIRSDLHDAPALQSHTTKAEPIPKPKRSLFSRKNKDTVIKTPTAEDKNKVPPVSLFALYRYHTPLEKTINLVGLFMAIAAGATQPLMTLIFGRLTTSFTSYTAATRLANGDFNSPLLAQARQDVLHQSALNASYLVYIGIGMFFCTYGYMMIWQVTSELSSRRIREKFLQATLRQEIAFFDDLGSGEVATRIESDTHLVHTGLGEKVPTSVQYMSTFVTGFVLAFGKSFSCGLDARLDA
jgi:ATP-binding cassette subfamily B (MDR/TAP) protein 1